MPTPRPTVVPPIIDPARWEDFPAYRETFLLHFTDPEINAAFRAIGEAFHAMALDGGVLFTLPPGMYTRHELAAAAADLRHLQGFLGMVGDEQEDVELEIPPLDREKLRLTRLAARLSKQAVKMASAIEGALAAPKGEE